MAFDINQLLQGRNAYGRVGGNIANIIGNRSNQGGMYLDPRLGNAGFGIDVAAGMGENPSPAGQLMQYTGQDKWNTNGSRTINGKIYHQIGDMFENGRNQNEDDIRKLVKDPSKIIYDDEGGLLIDDDNLLYRGAQDDVMDKLIKAGIMAGVSGGIGEAFGLFGQGAGLGTGGAEGAAGTFEGAGWAGSGINGATGVSGGGLAGAGAAGTGITGGGAVGGAVGSGGGGGGLFGGATGGLKGGSFLNQIGQALGIPSGALNGLNTVRQGVSALNLINGLTGGGGSSGRPGGSGMGSGNGILDIIAPLIGGYQDNRNIQGYESQINNLLDRGDPFREQRKGFIDKLNALYADPSQIENTPGYKFAKDQGLDAINRKMASRGMSLSGNELGEMEKFASGLAQQTFNKEREALMQMAGANFNPADMAGRGIQAYGNIAQMQANRNAGTMNGLFGNNANGNSAAGGIMQLINAIFGNGGSGGSNGVDDLLPTDYGGGNDDSFFDDEFGAFGWTK